MHRYTGLLKTAVSDGFVLNGGTSLQSLARFYGLGLPASEPTVTIADYVARKCCGQPRIGDRSVWERVELVVEEMQDQAISKVRLTVLPLHDRREPHPEPAAGSGWRARERRGVERHAFRH